MQTNQPKETLLVQCCKTKQWYNPQERFEHLKAQPWFLTVLQRLKNR